VIIEDEVDKHNFLIPPLLLQPIVENAIWHGIMHKESGKGEITIRYKFMGDSLVCLISDNGVGVKKAREIEGVNDAVSYGLKITKGRLKVFNKDSRKESSEKYSISVRDINKGGTVSGTEVEVEIPILISK
jgi:LytS/YehU family sensor histidine kinase